MKIRRLVTAGAGIFLLLMATVCAAQSLGDLARAEREKRAKQSKKPPKEFTNDNLPARPPEEPQTAASTVAITTTTTETTTAKTDTAEGRPSSATGTAAVTKLQESNPGNDAKTKEFWQSRFKSVREQLKKAEEDEKLAEDELQLHRIQQARELNPGTQSELAKKIEGKTSEIETKRAATERAKKALDDLGKEFKDSGAPDDWIKTD